MIQNSDKDTAEVLFSAEDDSHARALRRLAEAGALRRIYVGVYTRNVDSPVEAVVLRNWAAIVSHLLPGAVLAYRSALEHRPVDGVLHVRRGRTRRKLELPGLIVEVFSGAGAGPLLEPPVPDLPHRSIYLPSEARGFLENMGSARGATARVLPQEDIEARLDKILTIRGDFKFNDLRDQAKAIADKLDMTAESKRLDGLIGAMLGTHEEKKLRGKLALARAAGKPYDPDRLELFDVLHGALASGIFAHPADPASKGMALENFAFFEAYFSNFIEGTTFEVEEAEQIVFAGAIIPNRSEDSHDILGTFRAASTTPWRNQPAPTADHFLAWLKSVNALVMQARPNKRPGQWKEKRNMAGNTLFVLPEQVPATLAEGFERISSLKDPVARALMTMFVVSEVHPFLDGNGRSARLAMNCVLSEAGVCRIIVPTVYREDYLLPLKRLTNDRDAAPYIRTMTRIHDWTSRFDYDQPRHDVQHQLDRCSAFKEDLKNYRLIFPEDGASQG
ncbi:Fic family protein [Paraburkholderia sp. BL21I4N1]|uniref:Fic family protein n=1 Tax=Paraburkholderia sp. BL21I4N1 TaxID=1938801 RepID=UPI000CFB4875|nr:Fic family protein [Paraburkholderia sp. BL21I4N1]PQV52598.1 Fic/DOC family protein [Paraburkholderia sp. BL21I4N1]